MFLSSRGLRVLTDTTGWQGFVSSPCVAVARIPERNLQGGKIYLVRGFEGLVYVLGSVDSEPLAWLSITQRRELLTPWWVGSPGGVWSWTQCNLQGPNHAQPLPSALLPLPGPHFLFS